MTMTVQREEATTTKPSTSIDLRTEGIPSQYYGSETKLTSKAPFSVERCGEPTLHSTLNGGGKHRVTIPAQTHVGEISGTQPVYAA